MPELNELIAIIDSLPHPHAPWAIRGVISKYIRDEEIVVLGEWQSELIAFEFFPSPEISDVDWGTHFGPAFVGCDSDGRAVASPNITSVDGHTIAHWLARSEASTNPVAKQRYADLVWDFSRIATGKSAGIAVARTAIDEAVSIANLDSYSSEPFVFDLLERALSVACSIKDEIRKGIVRQAILSFEKSTAENGIHGLWGYSFDLLVSNKNSGVSLEETTSIIDALDLRLSQIIAEEDNATAPHSGDPVAIRLAQYYRLKNDNENVKRVLTLYKELYLKACEIAPKIVATGWLQKVAATLKAYNLKAMSDSVLVVLRDYAEEAVAELKPISAGFEISDAELNAFLDSMLNHDFEVATSKIVVNYVPIWEDLKEMVLELKEAAPLSSMTSLTVVDHAGRPVATIGGVDSDLEGRTVKQMSDIMQFSQFFLRKTMEEYIGRFDLTAEGMVERIYKSPVLDIQQRPILQLGMNAYFSGDWISAVHLFIPQIETCLRKLVELCGGATYKHHRNGGLMLKNFDELLRDPLVEMILSGDVVKYLRTLFSDQRGWNIRNRVCHGIIPANLCGVANADRLFHVLLLFGNFENRES